MGEHSPLLQHLTKYPTELMIDLTNLQALIDDKADQEVYAICRSRHGSFTSFLVPARTLGSCVNKGDTWYIESKAPKAAAAIDGEFLTNYVTYHIMADSGCLCNKCLSENAYEVLDSSRDPGTDTQWQYEATDINYENKDLYCDNCNEQIEASYD